MASAMLYVGSAIVIAWSVAHIAIPTRGIVESFGPISDTSRRILLMEWLMEGVLLIFIGVLVTAVRLLAPADEDAPIFVYRLASLVLLVMAMISLATGARTKILPMRLCPPIFVTVAILFWLPTLI